MPTGIYKRKPIIKAGDKYGRLTAITFVKKKKSIQFWLFKCDCGNEKIINTSNVKSGITKSCGCLKPNYKHGMTGTKTYKSWQEMKTRCLNKNREKYKNYGGRGIKICDRWLNSFQNFFDDMGERPQDKTLDRKDNDGNYEPNNCRYATLIEQANNTRKTKNNKIE